MADENTTNGRVTTAQFYELQLETRDQIADMERRLLDRVDTVFSKCAEFPAMIEMIKHNSANIAEHETDIKEIHGEIKELNKRSNIWNGINSIGVAIGTAIGALLGKS